MSGGTVYIVLFRGVGGKTQLPVAPLREKLALAGFENVATYINSGNAVVRSALPRHEVVEKVADVCAREFAFDKAIYAVARTEWAALIANNPFPDAVDVPKFLHAATSPRSQRAIAYGRTPPPPSSRPTERSEGEPGPIEQHGRVQGSRCDPEVRQRGPGRARRWSDQWVPALRALRALGRDDGGGGVLPYAIARCERGEVAAGG